jgi:hypothetical protein
VVADQDIFEEIGDQDIFEEIGRRLAAMLAEKGILLNSRNRSG